MSEHTCEPDRYPTHLREVWVCDECHTPYRAFDPRSLPDWVTEHIPEDALGWSAY